MVISLHEDPHRKSRVRPNLKIDSLKSRESESHRKITKKIVLSLSLSRVKQSALYQRSIRMLSRWYLLARRIAGEVMHKFAGSAKKRKFARTSAKGGKRKKRGPSGEIGKSTGKKGDPAGGRGFNEIARARYFAHCIIRNKFQWMSKHFHPIFFRRATYHTPEYLRRSYTPTDPSSRDPRVRRLWPRTESTLRFPSSTKWRDIIYFRNIWPVHPVDLACPVRVCCTYCVYYCNIIKGWFRAYNIGTSNDEYLFEGKKKTIIEENYVFVHMQKLEKMNSNFGSYKDRMRDWKGGICEIILNWIMASHTVRDLQSIGNARNVLYATNIFSYRHFDSTRDLLISTSVTIQINAFCAKLSRSTLSI